MMGKFLNTIAYNLLDIWDINRILQDNEYEDMVPLSSLLTQYQKIISKQEAIAKHLFIISKISFAGVLHLNDFEKIYSVKGTLYEIPIGAITYSKINVRHGCSYLNNTNNSILASSEYPSFIIDENKVYPKYLIMVLRCPQILKQFNSKLRGFTKSRVGVSEFLSTKIPLPSLEKQKELVAEYEKLQNLATQKEEDAKKIENSIDDYLLSELGIEHIDISNDKKTLFRLVNYMDLNKWIIPDNIEQFTSSKYNFVTFGNIVKEGPSYGANVKGCSIDNGCRYIRITDINDDGSLNNDIAYPERIDNRYLLKENDFLIARSGATVGKTFLYKDKFGKCIYAGYLVRYRLKACIVPEFLFYYTHSSVYKLWVVKNQRVAAQPNINGQEYLNFPLIVPSLKTQEAIIKEIDNKKEKIQKLRNESEQFKQQAISNFEQEVFN